MVSSAVYATAAELKAQPGMTSADDDTVLDFLLLAASRTLDGYSRRELDGYVAAETASTRVYNGNNNFYMWVHENVEMTLIEIKETTSGSWVSLATTDWIGFTGDPKDPEYNFTPYHGAMLLGSGAYNYFPKLNTEVSTFQYNIQTERTDPSVRVTAKWGYSVLVPEQIKQATITQAARWFKRGESFWSDMAADDNTGTLFYTKPLDPAIKMMIDLARLKRPLYGSK